MKPPTRLELSNQEAAFWERIAELEHALKLIVALDLDKDQARRDDFYSGADRFFKAWNIAYEATKASDVQNKSSWLRRTANEPIGEYNVCKRRRIPYLS